MSLKASKSKVAKPTPKGAAGRLFFLSASSGQVLSANPDGSDLKVIVSEGRRIPDGIVVDTEAGHLYWTNMGNPSANDGSIERADIDGSNARHIVRNGGTFTPKQLQLDRKNRKLYWSDREGMRIMRANLDGSKIETLVDTSQGDARPGKDSKKWCVGIALDVEGGKVYWTQKGAEKAGQGRIFRANLEIPEGQTPANRQDIEVLYDNLPEPIRAQAVGPVLARLRAMLTRRFVRQVVGQPTSSFDMTRILDGGILLCRLPKGVLGDDTARLLGSFVVASAWQAVTARAGVAESRRHDAVMVIDECQNFLNLPRSIDEICAEARGYHLSLILAHQDLSQLPRESAAAISANCRNKIIFNCSPEDARVLARHTWPELDEHDLSHLDRYTAATRLVIDGAETAAFTLRTNPPPPPVGSADAIRARIAQLTAETHATTQPANAQRAGLPTEPPDRHPRPKTTAKP